MIMPGASSGESPRKGLGKQHTDCRHCGMFAEGTFNGQCTNSLGKLGSPESTGPLLQPNVKLFLLDEIKALAEMMSY